MRVLEFDVPDPPHMPVLETVPRYRYTPRVERTRRRLVRPPREFARRPILGERKQAVADVGNFGLSRLSLGRNSNYAHWLHTGEGGRMSVGRVHMVRPPQTIHRDSMQNHFMTELETDKNRGRAMLVARSTGPFRHSTGPSRIQGRSAHVVYRRRGHRTEITIQRGVSDHELSVFKSKMRMHRGFSSHTIVELAGATRKMMGFLHQIDLDMLVEKVTKLLTTRRSIGIALVDEVNNRPIESHHSFRSVMSHTPRHKYR